MAVKTITIDLDAYEILSRHKRPGQSFSRVIKEHFERKKTGKELTELLQRVALSEETISAVERQVKSRRSNPARPAKL